MNDIDNELQQNGIVCDNVTLSRLVESYFDGLVRFAYCFVNDSAVAEDVVEDSFAVLVFKRKRFNGERLLRAYLYKVVRNKCLDYLRFNKRFVPLNDLENVLSCESAEESVSKNELYEQTYRALLSLPKKYKDVLTLVYLEGFSVAETTRILGKSFKQTYNLLARAKASLKQIMQNELKGIL